MCISEMMMSDPTSDLLQVEDLSVRYGAGPVVHGVNLGVTRGTVAALLGANGAGKSSTLRAIAGLESAQGRVRFDGHDVSGLSTAQRFRAGIVYVPEGRAIVNGLTVAEDLTLGSYFVDARLRARLQQMLAIGRGLMSGPRLLLLDEPSLGLAPLLVARVYERLSVIQQEQKLTALLVEQSFHVAAKLAARAWVMRHGHVVGELDAAALRSREGRQQAIDAYLGARQDTAAPSHA